MSKLISLLRATMSDGVQLFNYRTKNERSRRTIPLLLAVIVSVAMLFSAVGVTEGIKEDGGDPVVILSIYTLVTTAIIVTEGIYKSGDLLFKPRDNDTLLAMPIKKSVIVAARIIKFYLFELLYCLIFLLPAIIAYAVSAEVGVTYYFIAAMMLIMVPVIPIAVSCVAGLMTSAISARFRRRTFLQVMLSFILLFIFAAMILAINTTNDIDGAALVAIGDKVSAFYYPAAVFGNLVKSFDIGQFSLFVAINLAVAVATVLVISRFYFQIITKLSTIKRSQNVNVKFDFTKHSQTVAMVRKELTKYFNTSVLLMNTAIGLVLFIVAVGAFCLKFDDIVSSMMSSTEEFPLTIDQIRSYIPSLTFGMVAFASLMTFITTTMISLEGKAFNLLKSMPISGKKVIMTKVLSAMILIVPVTFIGSLVAFFRFQVGVLDAILVLIAVFAIPLVTELIGILIDLKYARFDAESDTVVVKQSAGVLISTFLGLGMVLFTISLTFVTVFVAGQTVGLLMMDAIFVIVSLFLYFVIAARGEEKYMKLNA